MTTSSDGLRIEYGDIELVVTDRMTFGRAADLTLSDDNRFLHREAGLLRRRDRGWYLYNTGSTLHLQLVHRGGPTVELPPSTRALMASGTGTVRVPAGPAIYEFTYVLDPTGTTTKPGSAGSDTVPYGRRLSNRQIDIAVTLARHRLVGLRLPPPGHQEIARLWGVSARTVGKTIEDIRRRLRDQGVEGIESQETLIEHLVTNRLITTADLDRARLDHPDGPVRREDPTTKNDEPDGRI